MENICVYFILQNDHKDISQTSDIMKQAFEICKQYVKNVSCVEEPNFHPSVLQKTDVIIFENFSGSVFNNLKGNKSVRILGPWALSVCLAEGIELPKYPWPIYSVAMYNLIVSCSHLPKKSKLEIKKKVQAMGGCYTETLLDKNTHLISDSTKSEKYEIAAEKGIKVMLPSWVDVVWEESQNHNIRATDSKFDSHECPPFHNLTICTTGLSSLSKRNELAELITAHGGTMVGKLNLAATDVLVCHGEAGRISEKYKAARKCADISCVTLDWVYDSVAKGYALKNEEYSVKEKSTSTPTKDHENVCPDFSMMSAIGGPNASQRPTIEETVNLSHLSVMSNIGTPKKNGSKRLASVKEQSELMIDSLDMKKTKTSRQFLDVCSESNNPGILEKDLQEFNRKSSDTEQNNEMEKYLKSNTCGQSEDTLAALLKNMENTNFSEPQNINGPQEEFALPAPPLASNPGESSTQATTITLSQEDSTKMGIFVGMTFLLLDFDEEEEDVLTELIESNSGTIVGDNYKEVPDYVVTLCFIASEVRDFSSQIVNDLWVRECVHEEALITVEYYHRPFVLNDARPLEECVVTVSNFTGFEKLFLNTLTTELGGVGQDQFAKITSVEKGVLAATHLISAETRGKKYEAALKWGLPVVSKDWLLECARKGTLVPEEQYLIGNVQKNETSPKNENTPPENANTKTPQNKTDTFASVSSILKEINKNATPQSNRTSVSKNNTPNLQKCTEHFSGKTPINQIKAMYRDTPDACSQVTPVNKILQEARRDNLLGTPETPKRYYPWDPKTPETPLGGIAARWSPETRKEVAAWINMMPDFKPLPARRNSTPLAEVKERLRMKFFPDDNNSLAEPFSNKGSHVLPDGDELTLPKTVRPHSSKGSHVVPDDDVFTTPKADKAKNILINNKLQQLEEMVNSSGGNRRSGRKFQSTLPPTVGAPISQPSTVDWDFTGPENEIGQEVRVFMISGVDSDERDELASKLENIGGFVSNCSNYDPSSTHLICSKPARNEKFLSCMASGKWILHTSYITTCVEAGKFLNEEEFEFGNPKFKCNFGKLDKDSELRMKCVHWWRNEIRNRGNGAFHDMKAIVVANKRGSLIRVIEAGGGTIVNVNPPFDDPVNATHCLIEPKSVKDLSLYIPLAQQGIFCVNTLYISDYLHRTVTNMKDCVLPPFANYYEK